jgi:acetyl-CoA C-acetyltransferase
MAGKVVIAGVGMVPFKKPGQCEPYDVMGSKAARAALKDAGIDYAKVQQAYAGYVFEDSCAGQQTLYHLGLTGIPVINVTNNCGSGSTAFFLAAQAVKSGAVDCALAVGFEEMTPGALDVVFPQKTKPGQAIGEALVKKEDLHRRMTFTEEDAKVPPALLFFGVQAQLVMEDYGVSERALARVAVKARRHAANNPYAVFRDPLTEEQILAQPPIYRGLRKLFACPPTCGAASVIVCSEKFARENGISTDVVLLGGGFCSDVQKSLEGDALDLMLRILSQETAKQAYENAGVGPDDIDVVELHDCFTSNEILLYNALGLCEGGDLQRFVMEDQNSYGGKVVVCPSGGLLAKGHPLGATGLAQITELVWQLRGQAEKRQVPGARTALQHNAGLGSASFVHIFQRQ